MSMFADPIVSLPDDLMRFHDDHIALNTPTWHLPAAVWDPIRKSVDGSGVTCCILDTGDYGHALYKRAVKVKNFTNDPNADDRNGHSTHCRGTIASTDPNLGIAPGCDIMIGKVLGNGGSGSSSGIAAGVRWAVDNGADVINLSLGGGSSYTPTNDAIKYAYSKGVIVVIAAGNSGFNGRTNTIGWPARSRQGVVVGATKSDGTMASFSSGGPEMDVAAPGERILSTTNNGRTGFMSGTSMATPFVAGCHVLILSLLRQLGLNPWTAVSAHREFLKANCIDILAPGHDHQSGYGIVDMVSVVPKLAKNTLVLT